MGKVKYNLLFENINLLVRNYTKLTVIMKSRNMYIHIWISTEVWTSNAPHSVDN